MRQCSLDARSDEQRGPPFQGGYEKKRAQLGPRWTRAVKASSSRGARSSTDPVSGLEGHHGLAFPEITRNGEFLGVGPLGGLGYHQ